MRTDLDTRLRELGELSPPSHERLGTEELHRRASKRRRRATILRAVPAVVVLALLAGAIELRNHDTTTDVVVGSPDPVELPDATGPSTADQKIVTYLGTVAELRHQVEREALLSAVWGGSNGANGGPELQAQRVATDAALQRYNDETTALAAEPTIPGDGATSPADTSAVIEAQKQVDNRLERIDLNRNGIDTLQSSPLDSPLTNLAEALAAIPVAYLQAVDDPDLASGILSASTFGSAAASTTTAASWLTVSVETGFYAVWYQASPQPVRMMRGDCGDDASAAGACWSYENAIALTDRADGLVAEFDRSATGAQREIARASAAGPYDALRQDALDGGFGRNDLHGDSGSASVDPSVWREAALERIDQMADAQRQLYELAGTPGG